MKMMLWRLSAPRTRAGAAGYKCLFICWVPRGRSQIENWVFWILKGPPNQLLWLRNRALPLWKRLKAWHDSSGSIDIHDADSWYLSAGVLGRLRTWELQMPRRRPVPVQLADVRADHQIVLEESNGDDVRACTYSSLQSSLEAEVVCIGKLDYPLKHAREFRSQMWWAILCTMSNWAKRRKQDLKHTQSGCQKTSWEHPFVCIWGITWRSKRDACNSLAEWMRLFSPFAHQLCNQRKLPQVWENATDKHKHLIRKSNVTKWGWFA